jgi:hypothetical protein
LQVRGRSFDTIVRVHETMWDWDTPNICRATLANWYEFVHRRGSKGGFRTKESFRKIICAEVVCKSGANTTVRRMVPEDELTCILWASKSLKWPVSLNPLAEQTWSQTARAWLDMLLLWPERPVLDRDTWESRGPGLPDGCLGHQRTREKIVDLLMFIDDESFTYEGMLHKAGPPREDAPWPEFTQRVRRRILEHYGSDVDLNKASRKRLIPAFVDSIMAATLNRRVIVGEKHIGLGPSDTRTGDKLFLLQGGKTPFVLRPKDPRAYPNTEFEVVGDCYIEGMMDGPGDTRKDSPWMSVSLV